MSQQDDSAAARRPRNVLFLFSDQHHADVLGCTGHPDALTPNLDGLAARGARFTRAYCQDAVCGPSRNSIFSGLYPRTSQCYGNDDNPAIFEDVVSLQSAFHNAGYATAAFGKRHLLSGVDRGWDVAASHLKIESMDDNYIDWLDQRGLLETFAMDWAAEFGCGPETSRLFETSYPRAPLCTRTSELPDDATMEAWTTQRSDAFMRQSAADGKPFFCFASFYRPHQPYNPLPTQLARFDGSKWGAGTRHGDGIAKPPGYDRPADSLPGPLAGYRSKTDIPWCIETAHQDGQMFRDYITAYYALVAEIDDHVGTLLGTIDELGLRDDTIIVYSADHGDFVGEHGLVEKAAYAHNLYESTVRVPLIIFDPLAPEPQVVADLVELVDLYPSLLDLCDVPTPELPVPLAGQSLAPRLREQTPVERSIAVTENRRHSTVINDNYKYCRTHDGSGDFLFNREQDPDELVNLIDQPDHNDAHQHLSAALDRWIEQVPVAAGSDS